MVDHATPVSFETAKQRAAQVIEKMLAGKPLGNEGSGSQFLENPQIKISSGFNNQVFGSAPDLETIRIELTGNNLGEYMLRSQEALESVLKELPLLKSRIQFGDADKEAQTAYDLLSELISKGADVPKELLKWPGFSHENNENKTRWDTAQHTTRTNSDAHGVTISINLPEHLNSGVTMNDIKTKLEARRDQMLEVFADRIAKYKNVRGNKEEEAKIREALKGLEFEVHSTGERITDEGTRTGNTYITLRTTAQKAAKDTHDKEHVNDPVDANPELESGNILQTIKPLELSKAAARAVLTGDMDTTVTIIGGKDVYRMLEKQLGKFKDAKPEFKEKIEEVLASTLFKDNAYDTPKSKQHEAKQTLKYDIEKSADKIIVDVPLPKDHAGKFIREVAAMAGPEVSGQHMPQVTIAPNAQNQFASVDSVELVGMHSQNPAVHAELQKLAAPVAGNPVAPEQANSFAENIISLIEQAYKQVQDGKKALAQSADQQSERQLAQNTASAAQQPATSVTPSSIASNRHPQLDINNLNWAEKLAAVTGQNTGYQLGA